MLGPQGDYDPMDFTPAGFSDHRLKYGSRNMRLRILALFLSRFFSCIDLCIPQNRYVP